jgi:hypothetical protein
MKSFLEYSKNTEKSEIERQIDHHEEMANKHKDKAEYYLMCGDKDGYSLHMAKHNHFKTQGDHLRSIKKETKIDESHVAIAMGKELDDEGSMAMNQLDQITRSCEMLHKEIKDPKMQLPAWVQSKLTLAADYMETIAGYMASKNEKVNEEVEQIEEATPAWQRKEGKSESGGLNRKGIASYRRQNPGSKLSMAVTTKPSKLKPGSKAANRRKSFCARMTGMKKRLTSAKTAKDPNSRINKSLRKWNC